MKLVSSLPFEVTPTVNTGMPAATAALVTAVNALESGGSNDRQSTDSVSMSACNLGHLTGYVDAGRTRSRER